MDESIDWDSEWLTSPIWIAVVFVITVIAFAIVSVILGK